MATVASAGPGADPRIALIEDDVGVVSVYLSPERGAFDRRLVRDKLGLLEERARSWRAADRRALRGRLPEVEEQLDALGGAAAAEGAPGLAAFFAVGSERARHALLPAPVPCSVSVDRHGQVGQLLAVEQAARPVGLVLGCGEPPAEARGARVVSGRRVDPSGWELALVAGRTPTAGIVPAGVPVEPLVEPAISDDRTRVTPAALQAIHRARRRHQDAVLDDVLAVAAAGGAATTGVAATSRALAAGDVALLLLADPAPAPRAGGAVLGWPRPAERLAREACRHGVEVLILSECPPWRRPRRFDGVAARLRS